MPFHGFVDDELQQLDAADLYPTSLFLAELDALLDSLKNRLGGRIRSTVRHQGRDTVAGRDYFFDQIEALRRGAAEPHVIGFFHYRKPDDCRGSFFEVWRSPHDSEPRLHRPLADLVVQARQAFLDSQSHTWFEELTEDVRAALGL